MLFLLVAFLSFCETEHNDEGFGVITGPDLRMCVCCGGWFIEIGENTYRFEESELPANLNFDLSEEEPPFKVKLTWQKRMEGCMGDEILITYIRKMPNPLP